MSAKHKAFWLFLCDNCDNAGIWAEDIEAVSYLIGEEINKEEALSQINSGKERIKIIGNGKWFIPGFIPFQYPKLGNKSNLHKSVFLSLKKYGLEGYGKVKGRFGEGSGNLTSIGIGIGISKGKGKGKEGGSGGKAVFPFEEIWAKYPKPVGKKEALRHFNASVKTEQDWEDIQTALKNYLESERVAVKGFIQDAKTWFNNWADWKTQREIVCPKCRNKGKYISQSGYEIICDCESGKRQKIPEQMAG